MNNTFRKTVAILFSRIVLKHLGNGQRSAIRKAEKINKQYIKIKSDLKCLRKKDHSNLKVKNLKSEICKGIIE